MKLFDHIARVCLIVALVIAAAGLVLRAGAQHRLHSARMPFNADPSAVSPPAGFLASGKPFGLPQQFRCALLQYSSTHCQFCASGRPLAVELASAMAALGCSVVAIAPSLAEFPRPFVAGEPELAFVRPGWLGAAPRLRFEPTSVLLGSNGKLLWYRVGSLNAKAVREAISRARSGLANH